MNKEEDDKRKTINMLKASKRKMEAMKIKEDAKNSGETTSFEQKQQRINETLNGNEGNFKEKQELQAHQVWVIKNFLDWQKSLFHPKTY